MFGGFLKHERVLEVLVGACSEYEASGVKITPDSLRALDQKPWARRGFWHKVFV
jgi:hypothetical protein